MGGKGFDYTPPICAADGDVILTAMRTSQRPGCTSVAAQRGHYDAVVEVNRPLCREHFLLRLRVSERFPATRPGQFIQLGCRPPNGDRDAETLLGHDLTWQPEHQVHLRQPELCAALALLRRPFSLAGRPRKDALEIVYRVVGVGTNWLESLPPGAAVDLIGPLGNTFTLPAGKSLGLLVGGGVGLPPMFYLAEALRTADWDAVAFVGALRRDLLAVDWTPGAAGNARGLPDLSVQQFARFAYPTVVTTNDGSAGLKGLITLGLEHFVQAMSTADRRRAVVFTCGPEKMLHAVAQLAAAYALPCQVCMEQAMACGMGTCQSCVVKVEDRVKPQATTAEGRPWRYQLACTDGPVFAAESVVW